MMQGLLTYEALAEHYGVSRRTMYQRVWKGEAPTPVLGPSGRVRGWRPEEVARWPNTCTGRTNKNFPVSKPGEKKRVSALHCPRFCAGTNITNQIQKGNQ